MAAEFETSIDRANEVMIGESMCEWYKSKHGKTLILVDKEKINTFVNTGRLASCDYGFAGDNENNLRVISEIKRRFVAFGRYDPFKMNLKKWNNCLSIRYKLEVLFGHHVDFITLFARKPRGL